ncbi:PepSY domain-containing protein [Novosphingobium sp. TCA1]|uniref:PepSY-associated TM helix domain-containing protein n=1 Tax=Novosphingobium sp. TCA1 TaxID=2682474 RepID=UPI001307F2BE|nr:PepSY-associated TM helix domain-containing protein [Novosphingobium sp. TCA1]GFE72981.1 hypothetical protein NTCA1_06300 [Novosphingobium sp. TCA1]
MAMRISGSTMRRNVRKVHLWLGLTLGGFFALLGLTGSALVFYQAIDGYLHPEIRVETSQPALGWNSPVWDRALTTLHARWPDRKGNWRFEVTGEPGALPVRYQPPHAGHHDRRVMVWLSPDGRTILREAVWGEYLMTFIYDLHMQLALGETGHAAVGWIGVGLVFLLATGLWAWWPRASWRKAFRYKHEGSPSRRLRDIHKLAGLGGLALLLMLAITGAMLALPGQTGAVMAPILGTAKAEPAPHSSGRTGRQVPIRQALIAAHAELPDARIAWVEAPGPGDGAFMVRMQQPDDPSFRFPHSFVFVDQYDGQVLRVDDSRQAEPAALVTNWLHPLHDGSIGGLFLRVLLVGIGLIPGLLFLTGLWRWRMQRGQEPRQFP